jgi:two-component system, LytTR family, response regulator LytT
MKILIAEDEAVIAISLFRILTELGYKPSEPAANAAEALETIESYLPDVAVVDIHLGESYTGFKVAKVLNEKNIPFFFLTALFDQETIDQAKQYGPVAYLVKPFTKDNLFATIELLNIKNLTKTGETYNTLKTINIDKKEYQINLDDFLFAEVKDKTVQITFLKQAPIIIKTALYPLVEQLCNAFIVQVHKSFIVNFNHATAIKHDEVIVNNTYIPIGRTFKENIKSVNWVK